MHTQLVNIGFIKQSDGKYRSAELEVTVAINKADTTKIDVYMIDRILTVTIEDLEESILNGGFGEF
jgi:hypothetical protein